MSLTTNKSITLRGTSTISGQTVVSLNSNIATDNASSGSTTQSIINQALYDANKTEVRKDIADFQTAVYDAQDSLDAEDAAENGEETPTDDDTKTNG